jgi:hypothetical protein
LITPVDRGRGFRQFCPQPDRNPSNNQISARSGETIGPKLVKTTHQGLEITTTSHDVGEAEICLRLVLLAAEVLR